MAMADYYMQNSACRSQLDSSGESSLSSPIDSSEREAATFKATSRPTRRYSSRGRKRGDYHKSYSLEDEEDKKRRRAKKERTRVSNLAVAYQTLARTIGLYPLSGSQKRITHEQILQGANTLITELKQEVDCLRRAEGKVVVVDGSDAPVYTPTRHYTISSTGDIVVVEESETPSAPKQTNHHNHLDLSCNETLPLPSLEESDGSSDVPISMHSNTQTASVPVLNYELVSPSTNSPVLVHDAHIQHILGLSGEITSTTNGYPSTKQSFLLSSPPFFSLNTSMTPPSTYQTYVPPPVDVGAYEEIDEEDMVMTNGSH